MDRSIRFGLLVSAALFAPATAGSAVAQDEAKVVSCREFVENTKIRNLATFCAHPASKLVRFEYGGVTRGDGGFSLTYVGHYKGFFNEDFKTELVFRFDGQATLVGVGAGKSTCLAEPFSTADLAVDLLKDLTSDTLELSKDNVFRKAIEKADSKTALGMYLAYQQVAIKSAPAVAANPTDAELIKLMRDSASMDEKERRYWAGVLPRMTAAQRAELRKILVGERDQLAELDRKYQTAVAASARKQDRLDEGAKLLERGESAKALDVFNRVVADGTANPNVYILRGNAHHHLKDYKAAIADYTKVIDLAPKAATAYRNRAGAQASMKNYRSASSDYTRATELEPDNPRSWNGLAWLLATCPDAKFRDGKEAVGCATKACELSEWKNPMYLDTLAAAYAEAGRFDKAVEWQTQSLSDAAALERLIGKAEAGKARERLEQFKRGQPYRE